MKKRTAFCTECTSCVKSRGRENITGTAMPGILPEMSIDESLDVTRIYSVADQLPAGTPLIRHRPFRAPHHTISHAGLVGGGNIPKPGEISLAHTLRPLFIR